RREGFETRPAMVLREWEGVLASGFSRLQLAQPEAECPARPDSAIERGVLLVAILRSEEGRLLDGLRRDVRRDERGDGHFQMHEFPAGRRQPISYVRRPASDHYLWQTGQGGKLLRGEIGLSEKPPTR